MKILEFFFVHLQTQGELFSKPGRTFPLNNMETQQEFCIHVLAEKTRVLLTVINRFPKP